MVLPTSNSFSPYCSCSFGTWFVERPLSMCVSRAFSTSGTERRKGCLGYWGSAIMAWGLMVFETVLWVVAKVVEMVTQQIDVYSLS